MVLRLGMSVPASSYDFDRLVSVWDMALFVPMGIEAKVAVRALLLEPAVAGDCLHHNLFGGWLVRVLLFGKQAARGVKRRILVMRLPDRESVWSLTLT